MAQQHHQQQLLIQQLQQQQPRVTPAIQTPAVGLTPTTTRVHIPYPCPIPEFSDYVEHHLRSGLRNSIFFFD
jgi:hypothetical protein